MIYINFLQQSHVSEQHPIIKIFSGKHSCDLSIKPETEGQGRAPKRGSSIIAQVCENMPAYKVLLSFHKGLSLDLTIRIQFKRP